MTTSKDVFALRKAGNLDAAYQLALDLNNCKTPDIWDVRALAWCLIDLIKRDFANKSYHTLEQYRQRLENIIIDSSEDDILSQQKSYALSMCEPDAPILFQARALSKKGDFAAAVNCYQKLYPNIPKRFHSSFGWDLYKYAQQLFRQNIDSAPLIKKYLQQYLSLDIEKPSKIHSAFLWLAKELAKNDKLNMGAFLRLWGMNTFRQDDFLRRTANNNHPPYPSLAEDVLQRAVKFAIKSNNADQMEYFIPFLKIFIERYPDNQWFVYYMGKSLVCLGRTNEAQIYCKSICKRKPNDFWTWGLLGDTYVHDQQTALACYAKALLCPAEDIMTINLRIKVAHLLAELGYYDQAKFEISKCVHLKEDIPKQIRTLMSQAWYNDASMPSSNENFYSTHAVKADELLSADLPWIDAVVGENFIYRKDGKPDQIRRKIYIKLDIKKNTHSKIIFPYESFCVENKFPYPNLDEGSPISIKGELIPDYPYQIMAFSLRDGKKWDIFNSYIGVINFVNTKKEVYHVVIDGPQELFFPFSKINSSLHLGDFVKLNISQINKDRYRVINVEKTNILPNNTIYKYFDNEIITHLSDNFGFTNSNIFLPPTLINKYNLNEDDRISGYAVLNYDTKKHIYDWKAITIEK